MDLSSVTPGANLPRFVNSQLVCLLSVGIGLTGKEGNFNITLKSSFREVHVRYLFILFIYLFNIHFALIYWLIDWLNEWLIDWMIDWLNELLIDWIIDSMID